MRVFRELYDIRPPHNVLCDESYLDSFSKYGTKTLVANSLKEFIGDKMKLYITSCSLHSSHNFHGVLPRGFTLATCSHVPAISGSDCVEQRIRSKLVKQNLILATADSVLFHTLRMLPGLPIVRRIGDQFHLKGPSDDERQQARIKKEQELAHLNG
ncbi:hypothetical protein CTI12_AA113680 [Artemisia annua]|uniref:Uncharacterized protein n=1 Tax=Artemisia annua TaxID=35608 RepID=A0A2U1PTT9_ARTAN|nr:hypothetical protein CTI12_AA113680 [Artemisia annua]